MHECSNFEWFQQKVCYQVPCVPEYYYPLLFALLIFFAQCLDDFLEQSLDYSVCILAFISQCVENLRYRLVCL